MPRDHVPPPAAIPALIILDVETTGVDRATDEVIELAVQFGIPAALAAPEQLVWRFRPSKSVGTSAKVHGITDAMLAAELPFHLLAPRVAQVLAAADVIAGYNVQFDLEMLGAAFDRARIPCDLSGKVIVDALRLWQQVEPRTLVAAHQRFVGSTFDGAHSAGADVAATGEVLRGMLLAFGLGDKSWPEISALADPDRLTWLGPTSHVRWIDGVPTLGFGKHKGKPVLAPESLDYLRWVMRSDFPPHVKEIAAAAQGRGFLAWALAKYPPPATEVSGG